MNTSYHETIKTEPYRALTGNKPRCGLNSKIPAEFLHQLGCSDVREEVLEHLLQESSTSNDEDPDEPADEPDIMNETMLQCIGDDEVDEEGNVYEDNQAKRRRDEDDHEESFEHRAKRIREEARLGIEKQASRMVERSKRKLKPLSPGDNVAIPTSTFDRSKLDSPNVIGVILEADEDGYVVGTKSGRIRGKMARSHIESINFFGLKDHQVPDKELSLREIVRAQSVCGGQGFKRCQCKTNCKTSRCSCRKAGLHCTSACHNHIGCDNAEK